VIDSEIAYQRYRINCGCKKFIALAPIFSNIKLKKQGELTKREDTILLISYIGKKIMKKSKIRNLKNYKYFCENL
jgi:hypothetical protein